MNRIIKIDNLKIIDNGKEKICIKEIKDKNIIDKYDYLKSKDFHEYPDTILENNYEKRKYIDEIKVTKEDKVNELLNTIIMLHTKTTYYVNISLESIKEVYEKQINELNEIKNYYEQLFDNNVLNVFQKPSILYLIKNYSLIVTSLDKSKYCIDNWYKIIKNKKNKRVVMLHNNLKLSNFILGKEKYLINWYNSIHDYQVKDLESLFKNNYEYLDMKNSFIVYNRRYLLFEEEKYFLYSNLLKINKITLNHNDLINTKNVFDMINYLTKVNEFLNENMKN